MKHSKMIPGINSQISFLKLPPISIHDAIIAFAHHCEVTSATLSSLAMVFSETKKWDPTGFFMGSNGILGISSTVKA